MIFFKFIRLSLTLVCLLFNFTEIVHSEDKSPGPSHLNVLGLTFVDCSSQDVYSKLGPGIPFTDKAGSDQTHVCYVSDKDDTLALFSFMNYKCSRFRLLSQKTRFYKWHFCEKSPLISMHLATESGIKLGMSKNSLIAILGKPQSESDEHLKFVFKRKYKVSRTEIEKTTQHSKNIETNHHRTVTTTIRSEFSESGLISFDVSQSLQ